MNNIYEDEELCEKLNDLFSLDITIRDIGKCTPEFVQKIYTHFLIDFGASIENLNQIPMNATSDSHQYEDAFKSSLFLFGLARTIKYYLRCIYNDKDFTYMDLFQPSPRRTKKFFSLFIDFYAHVVDTISLYEEIDKEVDETREVFERTKNYIKANKNKKEKRKMENMELDRALNEERNTALKLKECIEESQTLKNKLKRKLEEYKEDIASIETRIKDTDLQGVEAKEHLATLESQVILDEERILNEQNEELLDKHKDINCDLREEIKNMKQTHLLLETACQVGSSTVIPIMKEFDQENDKILEAEASSKQILKIISTLTENQEELEQQHQQLSESVSAIQELQAKILNSKECKKSQYIEDMKQLQLNDEEIYKSNQEYEIVVRDLIEEEEKLTKDIRTIKEQLSHFTLLVNENLREIYQALN